MADPVFRPTPWQKLQKASRVPATNSSWCALGRGSSVLLAFAPEYTPGKTRQDPARPTKHRLIIRPGGSGNDGIHNNSLMFSHSLKLQRTVGGCHGMSATVMACKRLSWHVSDRHGI